MLPPSLNNSQVPCPRLPSSAPTLQPQTPLPALCPPSHAPCPQQCFRGMPAFSWAGRSFLSLPSDFSQKYLPLWYPKGRRVPPTQVNGQVCVGVLPTPRHPSMQARDARAALHQRISSKPQHQARPPSRPLPRGQVSETQKENAFGAVPLLRGRLRPRPPCVTCNDVHRALGGLLSLPHPGLGLCRQVWLRRLTWNKVAWL